MNYITLPANEKPENPEDFRRGDVFLKLAHHEGHGHEDYFASEILDGVAAEMGLPNWDAEFSPSRKKEAEAAIEKQSKTCRLDGRAAACLVSADAFCDWFKK